MKHTWVDYSKSRFYNEVMKLIEDRVPEDKMKEEIKKIRKRILKETNDARDSKL